MRLIVLAALAVVVVPSVADAQRYVMRSPLRKMAAAAPAAPTVRRVSCPSSPTNQYVYTNPTGANRSSYSTTSAADAVAWANQQTATNAYAHFNYNGTIATLYQTDTPPVFDSTQRWTSAPGTGWYVCGV